MRLGHQVKHMKECFGDCACERGVSSQCRECLGTELAPWSSPELLGFQPWQQIFPGVLCCPQCTHQRSAPLCELSYFWG